MKKKPLHLILALAAVILLVGLDQWTKMLAVKELCGHDPFVLIEGVFELRYLENAGAAFGILQQRQLFFRLLTFAVLGIVVWLYVFRIPNTAKYRPLNLLAILICAGAAGNLIDRIRLGYVVDFIYFRLIDFPIFNVADCYVSVSAILLIFLMLFYYKEEDLNGIL